MPDVVEVHITDATRVVEVQVAQPAKVIEVNLGMVGPQGIQGPAGQDGAGATDPGDLTLIFESNLV